MKKDSIQTRKRKPKSTATGTGSSNSALAGSSSSANSNVFRSVNTSNNISNASNNALMVSTQQHQQQQMLSQLNMTAVHAANNNLQPYLFASPNSSMMQAAAAAAAAAGLNNIVGNASVSSASGNNNSVPRSSMSGMGPPSLQYVSAHTQFINQPPYGFGPTGVTSSIVKGGGSSLDSGSIAPVHLNAHQQFYPSILSSPGQSSISITKCSQTYEQPYIQSHHNINNSSYFYTVDPDMYQDNYPLNLQYFNTQKTSNTSSVEKSFLRSTSPNLTSTTSFVECDTDEDEGEVLEYETLLDECDTLVDDKDSSINVSESLPSNYYFVYTTKY